MCGWMPHATAFDVARGPLFDALAATIRRRVVSLVCPCCWKTPIAQTPCSSWRPGRSASHPFGGPHIRGYKPVHSKLRAPRKHEHPDRGYAYQHDGGGRDLFFQSARQALWVCPATAMTVWPRSVLTMPVVEADSALLELFDRRLQASLQALDATSESLVAADVRRVIVGRLNAGVPTIDEVAVELRTSRWSLQRRLAESGQTYQRVVDDTRCELTLRLLAEATMTIEGVAFMVGFFEASAFYRAFKRWKGTTPLQWRAASTPGQLR